MEYEKKNIVVCMRWGEVFPPDYVNVLYNALRENLSVPFEFQCFTTDSDGLHSEIIVREIPEFGLPDAAWRSGAWPKVSMLKHGLFEEGSRILFVDLDSMIVENMDEFFAFDSGFHAIGPSSWLQTKPPKPWIYRVAKKNLNGLRIRLGLKKELSSQGGSAAVGKTDKNGRVIESNYMGTGIFGFIANAHADIFDELVGDIPYALENFINEQHFIQHHLEAWQEWRAKSISSFKYNLRRPLIADLVLAPREPPAGSPLLAFHGHPRPLDLVTRRISRSEELPHVWFGPIGWFKSYWERHNRAK